MIRYKIEKGIILSLVWMVALGAAYFSGHKIQKDKMLVEEAKIQQQEQLRIDAFSDVQLQAKAAYVVLPETGEELYHIHDFRTLPLASLAKLASLYTALEVFPKDDMVTITDTALKSEGNTKLLPGKQWKVGDLAAFSLVASSNDGISALTERFEATTQEQLAQVATERMHALGFHTLAFKNTTGLDLADLSPGAVGNARDVAGMLYAFFIKQADILTTTKEVEASFTDIEGGAYLAENTNKMTVDYPNLIASKTGYTSHVGGNLAILFKGPHDELVEVVVLGSTLDGRFADVKILADRAYAYLEQNGATSVEKTAIR